MPNHVKSAYFHNTLLRRFNIENEYESIGSGDKVRYFYVQKPNAYNVDSIAYKYYYPDKFKKCFHVDYDKMFDKIIFSAIQPFYENVNWAVQKPGSLTQTNLLELLS